MTNTLTTLDILRQTRELLTPPDQWVKGEYMLGEDWDDEKNEFKPDTLVKACSVGAMLLARGLRGVGEFDTYEDAATTMAVDDTQFGEALKALSTTIFEEGLIHYYGDDYVGEFVTDENKRDPFNSHRVQDYVGNIINFNDYHVTTHADVLAAFDGAIARVTK